MQFSVERPNTPEHGREYINEPEDIEWEDTEQW